MLRHVALGRDKQLKEERTIHVHDWILVGDSWRTVFELAASGLDHAVSLQFKCEVRLDTGKTRQGSTCESEWGSTPPPCVSEI